MDDHNREKRELERTAIRLFIELYNREAEHKIRLLYLQDKPDAVLEKANRQRLGMEITHVYGSEAEAKRLLGRPEEVKGDDEGLEEDVLGQLNALIRKKESKRASYSPDYPVSLLIRCISPGCHMGDLLKMKESISLPEKPFVHIWLLARNFHEEWELAALV